MSNIEIITSNPEADKQKAADIEYIATQIFIHSDQVQEPETAFKCAAAFVSYRDKWRKAQMLEGGVR